MMTRSTALRAAWGALALGFWTGCGDPLLERQTIEELRVLGARYEAEDDPGRATPVPGERGHIRWLLASRSGPVDTAFGLLACSASDRARGLPDCDGAPSAEEYGTGEEPTLAFEVPQASRLLAAGVFCSTGRAALGDAIADARCLDPNAEEEIASYELDTANSAGSVHRHPDLDGLELRLDGELWNADEAPCVPVGRDARVSLRLPPEARELRPADDPAGPYETLQLSHLSTAGRFERPFTVFSGEAVELATELLWRAPAEPGTAHVYLVARDLRGGVSWVTRSLCVR
jgi:hypothetical protein